MDYYSELNNEFNLYIGLKNDFFLSIGRIIIILNSKLYAQWSGSIKRLYTDLHKTIT